VCLALAVIGAVGWVMWERRFPVPMIDLGTLARRSVWPVALVAGLTNGLGLYNSLVVSNYVQTPESFGYGMGASPLMAGVYLLPASIPIAFGGFVCAPIIRAFGPRRCMTVGAAIMICNQAVLATDHASSLVLVICLAMFGCTYAIVFTSAISALMTEARRGETGMLSSISTIASTVALAIIPAVIVATLTSDLVVIPGAGGLAIPAERTYAIAFVASAVLAVVILLSALMARMPRFSSEIADDAMSLEVAATTATIGNEVLDHQRPRGH
jgi:hypothetical protein